MPRFTVTIERVSRKKKTKSHSFEIEAEDEIDARYWGRKQAEHKGWVCKKINAELIGEKK